MAEVAIRDGEAAPPPPLKIKPHWSRRLAGELATLLVALMILLSIGLVALDTAPGHRWLVDRLSEVETKSGLRFRIGRIEGSIEHQQRVVVGTKGEVVAKVNASSIDVDGRVQGDMSARKSIKVSQSAVVRGNIRAPSVSITEGANFNGGVTMESNAGSSGPSTPGASGR